MVHLKVKLNLEKWEGHNGMILTFRYRKVTKKIIKKTT